MAFIIALGNDEGLGLERILYLTASLYSASIATIQSDQGSTHFKYSSALIIRMMGRLNDPSKGPILLR